MSATLDRIAAKLADETLQVMDKTGDDRFYTTVAQTIGAASQTLEEAYLTEIRIRLAARKAMALIQATKKSVE
ncbi:hypothetical protein SAMN05421762_1851 [Pseudooceanicola nitratireducens]|jgi:hypothetical protein|uniref:Uncharacterized protein n=1 Tax=Pseudooceanicola nitratireducens TaxID=517719 RepID=A0A1I1LFZ0_9RHOB|nr:hypothetical protein [Pseudooceanicola nitratireducens]SEJ60741.1 hypothetical protein SAMN05216183_10458 [Pseudooceanicola nitratireducens]SFC69928.1 hypothetical protein SAMN05421762_1851 [Pseudooceanicola nitratireducens]